MADQSTLNTFEKRAVAGDGLFAIAFALLTLAAEHRRLQENLTFGDGSANRSPGTLEKLAMGVDDLVEAVRDLRGET